MAGVMCSIPSVHLQFLSSNRLNVAISRARTLLVLTCSPGLLAIRCRTPEQMRLVNALGLLIEHTAEGTPVTKPSPRPAA